MVKLIGSGFHRFEDPMDFVMVKINVIQGQLQLVAKENKSAMHTQEHNNQLIKVTPRKRLWIS